MNDGGIYIITNNTNGKRYIGQTINFTERFRCHIQKLRTNKHPNSYLQNSWNKYGESSFKFDILLRCPDSELSEMEIVLIKENRTLDRSFGYNLREGGTGGRLSEETKEKLRLINLGKKHSEEQKQKITTSLLKHFESREGHMRGKRHSDATKSKMSRAHCGFKHSEASKEKIRNSKFGALNPSYGKPMTEQMKNNLAEINRNRIYKPCSQETREKMRAAKIGHQKSEETRQKLREKTTAYWARKRMEKSQS